MQDYILQQKAGITAVASGLAMVAVIFVVQHLSVSSLIMPATGTITLSEEQSAAFRDSALPTFGVLMIAIGISIVGIRQMLCSWKYIRAAGTTFQRTKISIADAIHKQGRVFWLALSLYSVAFLFASNTMIYSAERISERYGVNVPSFYII